jgi:hypothetical protein
MGKWPKSLDGWLKASASRTDFICTPNDLGQKIEEAGMSPERTEAYRRVIHRLSELGPAKLQPTEQERIRYAADSLVLCADLFEDDAARDCLEDTELLFEVLVQSGRWERVTADQLIDDLRACGPELPVDLSTAA